MCSQDVILKIVIVEELYTFKQCYYSIFNYVLDQGVVLKTICNPSVLVDQTRK